MPRNDGLEASPVAEPPTRGFDAWWSGGSLADIGAPARLRAWHQPPRERRQITWVLVLVLLGHVLLLAWLLWGAPPRARVTADAIEVTFFEPEPTLPLPPPLLPPPPLPGQPAPPPAPVRIQHPIPRAPGSITATMDEPPRSLDLYGANGQVRLPQGGSSAATPAYRAVVPTGDSVLTIQTPLHYEPTRFNKDWAPVDETNGHKLLNKLIEKTTVKKTVKLPTGDRVTCAVNPLLALAGGLLGCHGQIPPPPKNDDDIRLSLPPAQSLTGKKVELPASAASVATPPSASGD